LKKDNRDRKRAINGGQGVLKNSITPTSIVGEGIGTKEKFGSNCY
jgi:hypothetical protein